MALHRYEMTDFEWSAIDPPLPNKPRGVPRADDSKVLNGIFRRLRSRTLLQQNQAFQGRRQPLEKHGANYLALVKLAAARIWMRFISR
jgi:transposase